MTDALAEIALGLIPCLQESTDIINIDTALAPVIARLPTDLVFSPSGVIAFQRFFRQTERRVALELSVRFGLKEIDRVTIDETLLRLGL